MLWDQHLPWEDAGACRSSWGCTGSQLLAPLVITARIKPRLCSPNSFWLLCMLHLGTSELSGMGRIAKLAQLLGETNPGWPLHKERRQKKDWKGATGKAEERLKKTEMEQCYQAAVPRMWGLWMHSTHREPPITCLGAELRHPLHTGREAPPVTPGGKLGPQVMEQQHGEKMIKQLNEGNGKWFCSQPKQTHFYWCCCHRG